MLLCEVILPFLLLILICMYFPWKILEEERCFIVSLVMFEVNSSYSLIWQEQHTIQSASNSNLRLIRFPCEIHEIIVICRFDDRTYSGTL